MLIADTIWYPQKYFYYSSEPTIPTFEFQLRDSTQEVSIYKNENDCENSQNSLTCNKDSTDSTLLVCDSSDFYGTPYIGIIVNNQRLCTDSTIQVSPNITNGLGHFLSISFSNGKTCSTSKDNTIFITTTEPFSIINSFSNSVFYRQSDFGYEEPDCTHTEANNIITCDISTFPEGEYSVFYFTGFGEKYFIFDLSQMTNNLIKLNSTTIIGAQKRTKPFYINSNHPTFEIILDAVHTKQPKIYSDISLQNEIPCTRQGVLMTCTPDLSTLTQDIEYIVYYKDFCDEAIDTTVSFIYNENLIFVTGITVTENSQYSDGETSTFLIKTRDLPSGAISKVELTNIKDGNTVQVDSCSVSETVRYTIECDTANLPEGSYSLKSITGDKTYNIEEMSLNFMKISNIQLGIQIVKTPVVNSLKQFFNVILTSGNINSVYLDNDKTNEIPCTKMNDYYQCSPDLSSLTDGQTYEIFYENNIDELVSTGIIIEKVSDSTEIHLIDSITLSNGDICTLSSFSEVVIQTDSQTTKETSATVEIINKNDGTSFTTSTCVQTSNDEGTKDILTCNIPEGTTLTEGTYYISRINGVNKYYLYDVNGIEMTTEITPVTANQNPQTIEGSVRTFTVKLIEGITSKPLIYLENDKENEVSCEIDPNSNITLICSPTSNNMPVNKAYTVYYKNKCGVLQKVGLTVTRNIIIAVNNISISSSETCTLSGFDSFLIEINQRTTGSITKAVLTKSLEGDETIAKSFEFSSCPLTSAEDDSKQVITCSNSNSAIEIGTYSLTALEGMDEFNLNSLNENNVIKYLSSSLSSKQSLSQTVSKLNPKFTITLAQIQ